MSKSLLYILEPASDTHPYTHSTRLCMKAIHDGMGFESEGANEASSIYAVDN